MFKYTFNLNGFRWNIVFTENEPLLLVNNRICKGSIAYKTRTIYVDCRITKDSIKRVLAHELTHAILYDTQIHVKEQYSEEDVCEFCALYAAKISAISKNCIRKYFKKV